MITFDEDEQNRQLKDLNVKEEEDVVQLLATTKFNLPYANLTTQTIEPDALRLMTQAEAEAAKLALVKLVGKELIVAILSPEIEVTQKAVEALTTKGYQVSLVMVSQKSLEHAWTFYEDLSFASTSKKGSFDVEGEILAKLSADIKNIHDVPTVIEKLTGGSGNVSRIMEAILAGAITTKASDVHIELEEDRVRLRYRIDGLLQDIMFMKSELYKLLVSRIKLLSGLKLTITNAAQDGRFSIFLDKIEINIRVSFIPGAYGESIVMRLLDPRQTQVKLEDMGMDKKLFEVTMGEIAKPNGLILTTGPTGSGKTTTLYAFLRKLYNPELKIITIEDPIEYHLGGITQTQVEHDKNYDFLSGLRAALRQDPDVIMIGEIRDAETAQTAIDAALTGHLVFSTLHTNNAAGVIPRLIQLNVNPKIISSALTLSIAQRLVRVLCTTCKKQAVLAGNDEKLVRDIIQQGIAEGKDFTNEGITPDQVLNVYEPVGCEKCNNTGFKGRIGVYEIIKTDADIEKVTDENPSEREIKKIAEKQHIFDMKEDGIIKVLKGVTSLAELRTSVDLLED